MKIRAILFLMGLLAFHRNAHAYLDPGTGSMIIQMLIGGTLAAGYTLKVYWKKIKSFFTKKADPLNE